MILNYFKYAFRNLIKRRGQTLINLLGLSFGIACVIIIYLYSTRELSYNKFHENLDRIYRVYSKFETREDTDYSVFQPGKNTADL